MKLRFLALILSLAAMQCANATIINVDVTFDGSVVSLDAGSDTPGGSSLIAGDSVSLDLHAAGNDFWTVDSAFSNVFIPLAFSVNESGTRGGNVVSEFFLDGLSVLTISEFGVSQGAIHIGAQQWTIPVGISFDTILMNYELTSSTANTTISNLAGIFGNFGSADIPFYNNGNISYNSASVPEPSTLAIFGLGLLGLAARRFKKQA